MRDIGVRAAKSKLISDCLLDTSGSRLTLASPEEEIHAHTLERRRLGWAQCTRPDIAPLYQQGAFEDTLEMGMQMATVECVSL